MEYKLGPHDSLVVQSEPWIFDKDGDPELLEKEMCDFMIKNNGLGLAANQIGLTKRVFVMGSYRTPNYPEPFALFNPRIIESSKELVLDQEGCLSYPGLYLNIKRPAWVVGEYQNSKGDIVEAKFDGYLAKCFQHELDHLNGVCFVDIVSPLKLKLAMNRLRKNK